MPENADQGTQNSDGRFEDLIAGENDWFDFDVCNEPTRSPHIFIPVEQPVRRNLRFTPTAIRPSLCAAPR